VLARRGAAAAAERGRRPKGRVEAAE